MRLLHVTHQYRPAIGGSEQYMTDLSEALVARGHTVDVATTRSANIQTWRSELPSRETLAGVDVYRYRSLPRGRLGWHALRSGYSGHQSHRQSFVFDPLILFGNGPLAPGLAWHVLTRGSSYDAIHLQTLPYAHVVYGYLCAKLARRPTVITPHLHVDQPEIFDLKAYNLALRGADLVIAVSEREVSDFASRGIKPERVLVAGNGIKPDQFPLLDPTDCRGRLGIPSDAFVVLFLGRKVQYKGLETILRAFTVIEARHPNLYLVTAGPSTDYSQRISPRYSSLHRWIDLDRVEESCKLDLLNACDVLVLPSTGEAFGIVFLEAWAVKKPVIGARAGAIPWVIDEGQDGLLVEPNQPSDLAKAIETLVQQPQVGRALGAAGQQKMLRLYTVDRIADKIEAAIGGLVARRAANGDRVPSEGTIV